MTRLVLIGVVCIVALAAIGSAMAASTIFGTVALSAKANVVPSLSQDVDNDGCVGHWDLYLVSRDLGVDVPPDWRTDIDGNLLVDVTDLSSVAGLFGTRTFGSGPCP